MATSMSAAVMTVEMQYIKRAVETIPPSSCRDGAQRAPGTSSVGKAQARISLEFVGQMDITQAAETDSLTLNPRAWNTLNIYKNRKSRSRRKIWMVVLLRVWVKADLGSSCEVDPTIKRVLFDPKFNHYTS